MKSLGILLLIAIISLLPNAGAANVELDSVYINQVTITVGPGVNTGNMSSSYVINALDLGRSQLTDLGFSNGTIGVHNVRSHVTTNYNWMGGDVYVQGATFTEYIDGIDIPGPPADDDSGSTGGGNPPSGGSGGSRGSWACTRSAAGYHCEYIAY